MKTYTYAEIIALIIKDFGQDTADGIFEKVNVWLARGDGVVVYQNVDLGHPEIGQVMLLSWGSPEAQFEVTDPAELPAPLPDFPSQINFRYYPQGVYKGELL